MYQNYLPYHKIENTYQVKYKFELWSGITILRINYKGNYIYKDKLKYYKGINQSYSIKNELINDSFNK